MFVLGGVGCLFTNYSGASCQASPIASCQGQWEEDQPDGEGSYKWSLGTSKWGIWGSLWIHPNSHLMHDACYICCMSIRLHMFALVFSFNFMLTQSIELSCDSTFCLRNNPAESEVLHGPTQSWSCSEMSFFFLLNLLDCCVCASAA